MESQIYNIEDEDNWYNNLPKKEGKDFKINNQKLLFTYKYHLDKKKLAEFFTQTVAPNYDIKFLRIAHEKGKEYDHTHLLIDFGKPYQAKGKNTVRKFDIKYGGEDIHPHIKVIKTAIHWKRATRYLGKEDPENADLKMADATCMEKIQDLKTLTELFSTAWMTPQQAMGAKLIWENRPVERKINRREITLWQWQQNLVNELDKQADERKVIWITDTIGGMGKSKLIEWLEMNRPNDVCAMYNLNPRDASNYIFNAYNDGWNGKIILIDLARTEENIKGIYNVIEHLKNGKIINQKYSVKKVVLENIPHVVVFSNWMPIGSYLSYDRWDIRMPTDDCDELDDETGRFIRRDCTNMKLVSVEYKYVRPRAEMNIIAGIVGRG